jgi:hypothetical protein
MTAVLQAYVESPDFSSSSAPDFEKELLAYMVAHRADLSGYSLTNYHRLLQLCDFTRWQVNMGADADAGSPPLGSRYTMSDKDFLHAYACRALDTLLFPGGFVSDCSSIFSNLGSADPDNVPENGIPSQEGQAYYHAMDAIIAGKAPVARRDVLILLVLLIDQLECEYCDDARDAIKHALKEHTEHVSAPHANAPIDLDLEKDILRALNTYADSDTVDLPLRKRYQLRCALCDKILGRFGFLALYPPNPMDRLVMFSFLSNDVLQSFLDALSRGDDS